ncbi:hypothetical protein PI95_013750 [Hassallia byssoidea VB512170]|uniref:Uncharacterized protein n=1 Tax=Hassallia byssoidea VB512170 TaxID=1304833 RepID=A0A846H9F9_9CYAN|nr:hypothetical protein [Hassalia byssoidea]NEU73598.1 hypothetical protein [Hassalia byssoidea VB512170]
MPLFNDIPNSSLNLIHPGYLPNKYYASSGFFTSFSGSTLNVGYIYYSYFLNPFDQNFSSLAFHLNTVNSSTQKVKVAIYKITNGLPSTLVKDFGEISFTTAGVKETFNSFFLTAGWYAIALATNESSTSFICPGNNIPHLIGFPSVAAGNFNGYRVVSSYSSAYPNVAITSNITAAQSPLFWLKTA